MIREVIRGSSAIPSAVLTLSLIPWLHASPKVVKTSSRPYQLLPRLYAQEIKSTHHWVKGFVEKLLHLGSKSGLFSIHAT